MTKSQLTLDDIDCLKCDAVDGFALDYFVTKHRNRVLGTYQRENYWTDDDKHGFINAWMENMAALPIIINYRENIDEPFVVDGGHRVATLIAFHDGEIGTVMNDGNEYFLDFACDDMNQNPRNKLYTKQEARRIKLKKTVDVKIYIGLTEPQEMRLFEKVNKNHPLTKGQRMKAVNTLTSRALFALYEETIDKMQGYLNRRSVNQWGYHWFETVVSLFLRHVLDKGPYVADNNTHEELRKIADSHLEDVSEFKRVYYDVLAVLDHIKTELQRLRPRDYHPSRDLTQTKSMAIPFFCVLRQYSLSVVCESLSSVLHDRRMWDRYLHSEESAPNSQTNVHKKVRMLREMISAHEARKRRRITTPTGLLNYFDANTSSCS